MLAVTLHKTLFSLETQKKAMKYREKGSLTCFDKLTFLNKLFRIDQSFVSLVLVIVQYNLFTTELRDM